MAEGLWIYLMCSPIVCIVCIINLKVIYSDEIHHYTTILRLRNGSELSLKQVFFASEIVGNIKVEFGMHDISSRLCNFAHIHNSN